MLKWYADNSEMSSEKGKPNVLMFGGVIVNETAEKQIEQLLRSVKSQYTYPTLPIKWNFKDLKSVYEEWNRESDYLQMLSESYKWRKEIFEQSKDIDYKVVIACTERYPSKIPLKILKEQLIQVSFVQVLMRVGLHASDLKSKENFEIILDWPEGSNPKPFNREYFRAYNQGKSSNGVEYHCGPLSSLKFNDCLYFAKSTHSNVLQFTDLIIGAAKDFVLKSIHGTDYSLGYDLTASILSKYRGFPGQIISRGLNFAPRDSPNYQILNDEIKKNIA